MSVINSGGKSDIVTFISCNTFWSALPSVASGSPWIRRFGRLEYCSWLSASDSRISTFFQVRRFWHLLLPIANSAIPLSVSMR